MNSTSSASKPCHYDRLTISCVSVPGMEPSEEEERKFSGSIHKQGGYLQEEVVLECHVILCLSDTLLNLGRCWRARWACHSYEQGNQIRSSVRKGSQLERDRVLVGAPCRVIEDIHTIEHVRHRPERAGGMSIVPSPPTYQPWLSQRRWRTSMTEREKDVSDDEVLSSTMWLSLFIFITSTLPGVIVV